MCADDMKRELSENTKEFREMLQNIARAQFPDKKSKALAEKHTGISRSSIDNMLYSGEGGLDAWVALLSYAYKIKPKQLTSVFVEIKELFRRKRKLSQSEILWSKLDDQLSEDEKFFWHQAITTVSGIKSDFNIKKKRKS